MLLAVFAFAAVSASPSALAISPPDGALNVPPTSVITVHTAEPHPSIEVYEGVSGVRVCGRLEPFVARPGGAAVFRFAPTQGFKPGTTYKVLVGKRTYSFTTKARPRPPLDADGASA
jgi:hypothetical protein